MFLNNQKGMALFSVLIIMTITTLVGTAVWFASSQETFATELDENQSQAYHFAHSGVEMAISLIKSGECDDLGVNEEIERYGKINGTFIEEETDDFNINYKIGVISKKGEEYFVIGSVGVVRNGVAGSAEAKSEALEFEIKRTDITDVKDEYADIPLALFSNEGITFKGSALVNGSVATNAESHNSVIFKNNSVRINNGNLWIGPRADKNEVIKYSGGGNKTINIPDGGIRNLPSQLDYPMPDFPEFPENLPSKGTMTTDLGNISGKVYDSSGNGIGGVSIYVIPGIPGDVAKAYDTTVDNIWWPDGHGTWGVYGVGGSVIVKPVKDGYSFSPEFREVTVPATDINFEGTQNQSVTDPVAMDASQQWCWKINEDGYYDTIRVSGDRTLYIDLQGETRIIRVKDLDIQQGNIVLEGGGKLLLYAEETFNLRGSSRVNYGGDYESLNVFFQDNQSLNFSGNTRFAGSVFAQNADISISGSDSMKGHIITGGTNVSVTGAADAYHRILYAPNADLKVAGSGAIKGTVVVNDCTLKGSGSIAADSSLDTGFFDSLDWGGNGPPSLIVSDEDPTTVAGSSWRDRGSWVKK